MGKILVIKLGKFSHINMNTIYQLKKHFPKFEIDVLDLLQIIRRDYFLILINTLFIFIEYFFEFITLRKSIFKLQHYFYGTTYLFKRLSKILKIYNKEVSYNFIFQLQGMCDSSYKGIPNFIYTDHTNLNNLNYPAINKSLYLRSGMYIKLEKQAYENTKLIFVMSKNIKKSLIDQYGINPEKIKLVFTGCNTDIPKNIDDNKYYNKNILFVGKDWKRKGGPLLIRAFKIVQKTIPDATLTIIGCNPKIKLAGCNILGKVPLQEVAYFFDKASVFCMPTTREPFGIVFIEAMFNRLPVVTNNIGAIPDFIVSNENGYILDNDEYEYAKNLIFLLNNPDICKKFGDKSYNIVREKYTWDNVGNLLSKYINEAIGCL